MKCWKLFKRIFLFSLISICVLLLIVRNIHYHQEYAVNALHSSRVIWDFVADLNHMKITNPGLKQFEITSDGGTHPEWHYNAILTEDREQFGVIKIHANYIIKPYGNNYIIIWTYELCKYFMCAQVNSTMIFKNHKNNEKYKTRITEDLDIISKNIFAWIIDITKIVEYHKAKLTSILTHMTENISV